MRRTDALFQLIKALNRADKRNFKLLTQLTSGDKKYLRLFDAIDRQSDYDENRIMKQFEGDNLINQFSVSKNYLYNSILKSLTYFYKGENAEMTTLALQVRILLDKNLFPHAQKLLRKAKAKARKQENFYEHLQLLELERQILIESQDFRRFGALIREIQEEEIETERQFSNAMAYRRLLDKVYEVITASQQAREKDDMNALHAIMNHELMTRDEDFEESLRARILFFTIKGHYFEYRNDYKTNMEYVEKAVAEFDKSEDLKEAWVHRYISTLYNYALGLYRMRQIPEAMAILKKMRSVKTRSEKANVSRFEKYHHVMLMDCANAGRVREGAETLRSLEADIRKYKGQLKKSSELIMYYFAALLCLVSAEYKEALRWINKFLNEPRTEVRRDLQCAARLLNLIIHYELGNYDLIEHSLKSTYRFIFKRDRMYRVERLVLRNIKLLALAGTGEHAQEILTAMHTDIQALEDNPYEQPALNLLMLDTWVESKVTGIPMARLRHEFFEHTKVHGQNPPRRG